MVDNPPSGAGRDGDEGVDMTANPGESQGLDLNEV
jgi:hypothetical protein